MPTPKTDQIFDPEPYMDTGPLVPFAFRVGITGHRPNKLSDIDAVKTALCRVIEDIKDVCADIAQEDADRTAANDPHHPPLFARHKDGPVLHFLSPLAEGADRLGVDTALNAGFELTVPLPFAADQYREDFGPLRKDGDGVIGSVEDPVAGTVGTFDAFLKKATSVVTLAGDPEPRNLRNQAYLEAGRFVVNHSDLLIAVWNGDDADGRGGTAEIVEEAWQHGLPVVWVCTKEGRIGDVAIRLPKDPVLPPSSPHKNPSRYTEEALKRLIAWIAVPYEDVDAGVPRHQDYIEERGFLEPNMERAPDYRSQGPIMYRERRRYLNGFFGGFQNVLLLPGSLWADRQQKKQAAAVALPTVSHSTPVDRLYAAYLRADSLSYFYSKAYRSALIVMFALAAIAVSCAVIALVWKSGKVAFTGAELAFLVIILFLYLQDRFWSHRHRRWLDYRILAELLRPAPFLALVGAPMTYRSLDRAVSDYDKKAEDTGEHSSGHLPSARWAFTMYRTIVRHAGVVGADQAGGTYAPACCKFVCENLLENQISYHQRNHSRSGSVDRRLKYLALGIFFFSLIIVVPLKIMLITHFSPIECFVQDVLPWDKDVWIKILGICAAALPALAATGYAIRSHNELEVVSHRSEAMLGRLKKMKHYLSEELTDTSGEFEDPGLTMQRVTDATRHAADIMVDDSTDWLDVFKVKEIEAGG